jgi:hypothetical protein
MGIKFKLTLNKVFDIDTDKDWGGEHANLIEILKDKLGVDPGTDAGVDEIHDAIREMLADDIEYVVDVSLDETDFEIEVPTGTTFPVPAEDED